jgi:hypothetical protein
VRVKAGDIEVELNIGGPDHAHDHGDDGWEEDEIDLFDGDEEP